MKKSMIAMIAALLVLSSVGASAMDNAYVNAGMGGVAVPMTASSDTPATGSSAMGPSPQHTFAFRKDIVCDLDISASPNDLYFLGKARQECVTNNRNNMFCQNNCFNKVKYLAQTSPLPSRASEKYTAYYISGCTDANLDPLIGMIGNDCYFKASEICAKVSTGNNYCRQKCTQRAYTVCRSNVLNARAAGAKSTVGFSRLSGTLV